MFCLEICQKGRSRGIAGCVITVLMVGPLPHPRSRASPWSTGAPVFWLLVLCQCTERWSFKYRLVTKKSYN